MRARGRELPKAPAARQAGRASYSRVWIGISTCSGSTGGSGRPARVPLHASLEFPARRPLPAAAGSRGSMPSALRCARALGAFARGLPSALLRQFLQRAYMRPRRASGPGQPSATVDMENLDIRYSERIRQIAVSSTVPSQVQRRQQRIGDQNADHAAGRECSIPGLPDVARWRARSRGSRTAATSPNTFTVAA